MKSTRPSGFFALRWVAAGSIALGAVGTLAPFGFASFAFAQDRQGRQDEPEIMPVSEIQPGMKGYGLTVFEGTRIDRFDVEVIDVLKNVFPRQDMILIRCAGPVIEKAHIIAGMSGSPVYLEDPSTSLGTGKLVGALAYGWAFTKEAIAGVTPIENMLAELERPWEEQAALPDLSSEALAKEDGRPPDLPAATAAQAGRFGAAAAGTERGLVPLRSPLLLAGLTPRIFRQYEPRLRSLGFLPVQGGSGSAAGSEAKIDLEPGAAIGVSLARGDIDLTAIGTVTWRKGNQVLAFGHDFLGGGQLALPVTTAYVHGIMAGLDDSFKFASPIKAVGTLEQDRLSCILGSVTGAPSMIPVRLRVRNAGTGFQTDFKVEVADHPSLTALLVDLAAADCLDAAEPTLRADVTARGRARLQIEGQDPLEFEEAFALESRRFPGLQEALEMLLLNPFERLRLKEAEVEISVERSAKVAWLEAVWADPLEVYPGETVTVVATLRPRRLEPLRVALPLEIPISMQPGKYEILVGSGSVIPAPVPQPYDVDGLYEMIRKKYPSNMLVASLSLSSAGMHYRGKHLRRLPPSVLRTLATGGGLVPELFQDVVHVTHRTDWVLAGPEKRITIEVRKHDGS